jgi:integrase
LIFLRIKAARGKNKLHLLHSLLHTTDWNSSMKKQYPHLAKRGNTYRIRRRIPAELAAAYPSNKKETGFSLRTSDLKVALQRLVVAEVKIENEFTAKRKLLEERKLKPSSGMPALMTVSELSDIQIQHLAQSWTRQVILTDLHVRRHGLADDEFDELGERLATQRRELGRMLARGNTEPILPVFRTFCHLNGIDAQLTPENSTNAAFTFLRAMVSGLDHQIAQQEGNPVDVDRVAPSVPESIISQNQPYKGPTWDEVFEVWKKYVDDRPKSTIISCQTPWGQLERFAQQHGIKGPGDVTSSLINSFIGYLRDDLKLTVKTVNGRLGKLKEVYRIAVGREQLANNPTLAAIGYKESSRKKAERKRLAFSIDDIQVIFGSAVFTKHARSRGQSGEACYWIPLIMYYSGARPEEIAGLPVSDIKQHPTLGWHFDITDIASPEDAYLFDDDTNEDTEAKKRTLKNIVSRRKIPVARELISLGLLDYVEYIRSQRHEMLFPSLKRDFHEKYSGAFGKWFGRYKVELGFKGPKKTLYSLRHTMKDLMETAKIPSKYLKRIMGHASGDGIVTDGYGSEIPFEVIHEYFSQINFPNIPAVRWRADGPRETLTKKYKSRKKGSTHCANLDSF